MIPEGSKGLALRGRPLIIEAMRSFCLLLLCTLASGCSLPYYAQSASGHLSLMSDARPVDEVLADGATDDELRARLESAVRVRDFASRELDLPDNDSYRAFVEVEGDAVVYSVVAAPEFSLEPRTWCFLFVGCLAYRGYYDRLDAQEKAVELSNAGYDAEIRNTPAYSTLGWFDDPLVSTMLDWGDVALARIIFHELAHQQLYIDDDSAFNEAFANVVAEEGLRRFLRQRGADDVMEKLEARRRRQNDFHDLLGATRERLETLYRSELPAFEKRIRKQQIINDMREDYRRLKRDEWDGYAGYDGWFDQAITNADFVSIATYHDFEPAFRRLLAASPDLPAFYEAAEWLGNQPPERREVLLSKLEAGEIPEAIVLARGS